MSNYCYTPWIARKMNFILKVYVHFSRETISIYILDRKVTSSLGIENFTRMMKRRYWRNINLLAKNHCTFCPPLKMTYAYVFKK